MGPVRARLRSFILNAVVDGTELDGKRVRLYSLKLKETAILTGALMAGPTRRRVVLPLSMIPLSEGIVEDRGTDGMCVSDIGDVCPWRVLGRNILVISTSHELFFSFSQKPWNVWPSCARRTIVFLNCTLLLSPHQVLSRPEPLGLNGTDHLLFASLQPIRSRPCLGVRSLGRIA